MKVCTKCLRPKELDQFAKRKMSPDGLQPKCRACANQADLERYRANKAKYIKNAREWRLTNPDRYKEIHRASEQKRRDKDPAYSRQAVRKHRLKYPEKLRIKDAARKRQVRKSTPSWAKRGLIAKQIREIYALCPREMVVDHIIPLRGENVSGLHVPWNFQYMNPIENIRKSNKFVVIKRTA